MRNDCSIVCDLLPLYLEKMVSEDTEIFIKEHLEKCPKCTAEFDSMKSGYQPEKKESDVEDLKVMKAIKKKMRKDVHRKDIVKISIIAILCLLIYCFPIYRLALLGPSLTDKYYTSSEIAKALYIGNPVDRMKARSITRLAEQAFEDIRHTNAENEEKYGLLSRYATDTDSYEGAVDSKHSLKMWSAHLDNKSGKIWVYYTSEVYDVDGNIICGSWKIPALWKVEKNEYGEWVVVDIIEHP